MNEELSIIDLEKQRQIRASQVNIVPRVKLGKPVAGVLASMFAEVMANPAKAAELEKPDEEYSIRAEQERHQARVASIQAKWNAPRRQLELETPELSGPWGTTLDALISRLGSGFLIALLGIRGNGKTQLGVELMKHLAELEKSSRWCTATQFFMDVRAAYRPKAEQCEAEVIGEYRTPLLLVIDEAARRGETEWEDRLLFELVDKRYGDMTDTVLISNQTEADFLTSIGPSLASRMQETGGVIECDWPSFRK